MKKQSKSSPARKSPTVAPAKRATAKAAQPVSLESAVVMLQQHATKATLDGMARFGLPSDNAIGVPVNKIQFVAKTCGKDHDLALALWQRGGFEDRMLAVFVDDPAKVTSAQMDRWCRDFDNWGIVDTACFHLFDRSPLAYEKIAKWSTKTREFEKRSAFALLASVALHDKKADDEPFIDGLRRIELAASDERNFVKKALVWALRGIASRNARLKKAAQELARKLAASNDPAERWVGKDASRKLKA